MRNPLTSDQKKVVRADVTKAIGQICDAWPDAVAAEQARGFPSGQGQGSGGIGSHGDPTPNASLRADKAGEWLGRTRRNLALLVRMSAGDAMWAGSFNPPAMKSALISAAVDLVEIWPKNVMKLFHSLYDLANQGITEWPPTPRKGTTIRTPEGDVIVGQKSISIETCAKCNESVFGGALDPIKRMGDKPYHKKCYMKVWREKQPKKVVA